MGEKVAELDSPLVLLFHPFPYTNAYEENFPKRFRPLNLSDSSSIESIHQFLKSNAESVRVMVCSGFNPITSEFLKCLPSLQCVVTTSTGLEHLDLKECRKRGIAVANAGKIFSEDVADYALGLLLDVLRGISAANLYVRNGLWPKRLQLPLGVSMGGKRVGIVGLGSIGSKIAKRLEGFGCSISYNSRRQQPLVSYPYYSNVYDLAHKNDVLIVCCALTKETYHIINKEVMIALGREGVLINVGRGALVDENELVKCLVNGEIKGAGLDVFENEPNVPKELFGMDNVVLSPHRAILTPESCSALHDLVIANLEAFLSNKPLLTQVEIE